MSFAWGVREREREKKEKEDHANAKKEFDLGMLYFVDLKLFISFL